MFPLCCSRQLRDKGEQRGHKQNLETWSGRMGALQEETPKCTVEGMVTQHGGHRDEDLGSKEEVPTGPVQRQRALLLFIFFFQFEPVHIYQTHNM